MLLGKGSEIYKKLYDAGLINNTFSTDYTMQPDYGFTSIDGESKDPEAVFALVMDELDRVRAEGLSETDFELAKKVAWGKYIRSHNDIENYAVTFLQLQFMDIDYFNYYDVYNTVTFEDVKRRFDEHFSRENAALSVIRPL